jgi:hypothetical protein
MNKLVLIVCSLLMLSAAQASADDEARLRELARARGIGFVSPLRDFESRPREEMYLLPLDDHLAPGGAERVAWHVAEALLPALPER